MKPIYLMIIRSTVALWCILSLASIVAAQSTDQSFPTAVTTNEINGAIKVREVGDARLTSHYYVFEGSQGDIFINVLARNFSGDVDVFAADGLRPLGKMVFYADAEGSETGRVIYLRKGERMLLRIQGRSPNDDPASYRIKFAGSFVALADGEVPPPPVLKADGNEDTGIKVNSVGTIIAVTPKPVASPAAPPPTPKPAVTAAEETASAGKTVVPNDEKKVVAEKKEVPKPPVKRPAKSPPPVKTLIGSKPKKETPAKPVSAPAKPAASPEVKVADAGKKVETSKKPAKVMAKKAPVPPKPDPMAGIRLVIQLKDGETVTRPMSEVRKFSVDAGVLTVIGNDGQVKRYSILDVTKVTIE